MSDSLALPERRMLILLAALLVACSTPADTASKDDADGDGFATPADCDDGDAAVYPGANELCDGVDNDCDDAVDDDADDATAWFADADGDGWGDVAVSTDACVAPPDYVADPGDCADDDPAIHPGATETCDGYDNDCDDVVDPDGAEGAVSWYPDADGDGAGRADAEGTVACAAPAGYSADATDCDDTDSTIHPGATEQCDGLDNDCDGDIDPSTSEGATVWYLDADHDDFGGSTSTRACAQPDGYVAESSDCNDDDPDAHPGAPELCNGRDDDCDTTIDPDSSADALPWYADADGDGYGGPTTTTACEAPSGYVGSSDDCDDADVNVNPAAVERCNSVDDDCDGAVDPDSSSDAPTWHLDTDGDSYGGTTTTRACAAPADHVADGTDCDDTNVDVHPGAEERCNDLDDDCDTVVDPSASVDARDWFADGDGDGYGAGTPVHTCSPSAGFVGQATDCDDAGADVHPGAPELCNGADDDCDGVTDPDTSVDAGTWFEDSDGDGFGSDTILITCAPPDGWIAEAGDCDDAAAAIHPGALESCNALDDDCDGSIDPPSSTDATPFYADFDHDGFGDSATPASACTAPAGFVADARDCDDDAVDIHPGGTEVCNSHDDDCDGTIDPPTSVGALTWHVDADADGYGDATATVPGCTAPGGAVGDATDCDDGAASVNPGATEVCDAAETDEDCDGAADDADDSVTGTTTWYPDDDNDGFGAMAGDPVLTCLQPVSTAPVRGDCDDSDGRRNPDGWPCTLDVPATEALAKLTGSGGEFFGYALHGGTDYNLDGEPDFLIGAYYGSRGKGAAYMVYGPITGSATVASVVDATFSDSSASWAGYGIPHAGDLDGDGHDDLAFLAAKGGFFGYYTPVAAGTTLPAWDVHLSPEVSADYVGTSAGDFDLDGDGQDDLAVADGNWPDNTQYQGSAYVAFGPFAGERSLASADLIARGEATYDCAGCNHGLAVDGDLDGDGAVDLLVGAVYADAGGAESGAAYVVSGVTRGTVSLSDADARIAGEAASEYFGEVVLSGGDLDGDGYDDMLVTGSRYGSSYQGGAWVFAGPLAGESSRGDAMTALAGTTTYDYIGHDALPLGDYNDDGQDDLVVGALLDYTCGNADGSGSVYIFHGPITGSIVCEQADTILAGSSYNNRFSVGMDNPGDLDGDGLPELFIGSYQEGGGAARLYEGVNL